MKGKGWPLKHSFKLSLVPAVGRPGWQVGSDTRSRMGRLAKATFSTSSIAPLCPTHGHTRTLFTAHTEPHCTTHTLTHHSLLCCCMYNANTPCRLKALPDLDEKLPRLEGKQRTLLSSQVATRISWSPLVASVAQATCRHWPGC